MLKRWTKWRLDRGKLASRFEQFIVELLFKLGRKKPLLAKSQFKMGVDCVPILKERKYDYPIRPAVYRTIHGISMDKDFREPK